MNYEGNEISQSTAVMVRPPEKLPVRWMLPMSGGDWTVGPHGGTVITQDSFGFIGPGGYDATEYYGGYLIAESIMKRADAKVMAASRDMLLVLKAIDKEDHAYLPVRIWDMIDNAIKKATS